MNQEARLFGSKEGENIDSQAWNDKQHGIQINKKLRKSKSKSETGDEVSSPSAKSPQSKHVTQVLDQSSFKTQMNDSHEKMREA